MRKRQIKYVRDTLRNNRDKAKEMQLIYFLHLSITKRCRRCKPVIEKYRKEDEQDIDKVFEPKQYCPSCRLIVYGLHKRIDEEIDNGS